MSDCKNMEYSKLKDEEDVHFAHNRGFIAKTSAVKTSRLKQLLINAYTTTPIEN